MVACMWNNIEHGVHGFMHVIHEYDVMMILGILPSCLYTESCKTGIYDDLGTLPWWTSTWSCNVRVHDHLGPLPLSFGLCSPAYKLVKHKRFNTFGVCAWDINTAKHEIVILPLESGTTFCKTRNNH